MVSRLTRHTHPEQGSTLVETLASLTLIAAIVLSFAALTTRTAQLLKRMPARSEETRCTTLVCSSGSQSLTCSCKSVSSPVLR